MDSPSQLVLGAGIDRSPLRLRWNTAGVEGVSTDRMLVTATAFKTLLWRIVVIESGGTHYREGFYSVIDGDQPIHFERFGRDGVASIADLRAGLAWLWARLFDARRTPP